ncbi:MAG TPA: formate/nitrite transporter family protein, partial [Acidimicrobiia bacterium]|nr:formate/nitrite transporter family protein [Acidimicrobiia bacterium]
MATRLTKGTQAGDEPASTEETESGADELTATFERTVAEGEYRLTRSWPGLLATGVVGGLDVGVGVLGLLLVKEETGSSLLAGLAFGIGFMALTLAGSELFTENFLVPVAAVTTQRATLGQLLRLWAGTATMNLAGGWVMMGLIMAGQPKLRATAVEIAHEYATFPAGRAFALAILGGVVITLMTWMERATESVPGKLAAAVSAAFLLVAGTLNHAIVVSLLLFAALHAGAPFGYLHWLAVAGLATAGNMVGGLGLVTMLRLVQVGHRRIEQIRDEGPAVT